MHGISKIFSLIPYTFQIYKLDQKNNNQTKGVEKDPERVLSVFQNFYRKIQVTFCILKRLLQHPIIRCITVFSKSVFRIHNLYLTRFAQRWLQPQVAKPSYPLTTYCHWTSILILMHTYLPPHKNMKKKQMYTPPKSLALLVINTYIHTHKQYKENQLGRKSFFTPKNLCRQL